MGRLYDAFIEVGPRFTGMGDVKSQGEKAGREYGKALTDAAEKAAKANIRRLGEALGKAREVEADAAGKVRVAEAKLAEVRTNSKAKVSQIAAAEEALAAAQRKSASAANTAKQADESLTKARKQLEDSAGKGGAAAGGRFSRAFKGSMSKLGGDREGKQFATRFGVGMNGAIGGIVSRSAKLFVVGFAAIKGAEVFGSFINDARESAKVARVSAQVVRSTGAAAKITADQMGDLATAISNKTGADDEDVQSGENLLATFTNVRNEVGKNNDIFNRASQAAVDMASAMNNGVVDANGLKAANIQLGKALNDPVKGVTALSKVGVSFTQQQQDQIKALVDSGKTLDAQKIILAEVGKEFGGAAAAASDPMTKLGVIVGNTKEAIGGAFLPIVEKVATKLGSFIPAALDKATLGFSALKAAFQGEGITSSGFVGFMERVGVVSRAAFDTFKTSVLPRLKDFGSLIASTVLPAAKNLIAAFMPLAKEVGAAIVDLFQKLAPAVQSFGSFLGGTVLPAIRDFTGFLKDNKTLVSAFAIGIGAMVLAFKAYQATIIAVSAVTKVWTAVQAAFNVVMSLNPIGIVALALVGLAAGLVYAYKHSETFRDVVNGAFGAVKGVVLGAVNAMVTAFHAVSGAIDAVIGFVKDHWRTILPLIVGPIIGIPLFIALHWAKVKEVFMTGVSAVLGALRTTWGAITGVISGPVNAVVGVLQAVWSRVGPILVLPFYIARSVISAVFAGIQAVFAAVGAWVTGTFAKAWSAVSRVLSGPMNTALAGVRATWNGITIAFNTGKTWVTGAFSKAWSAVKAVISVPVAGAKIALDLIWGAIRGGFNATKNWATSTFSRAWAGLKTILTTPISLARTAISGILGNGKGGLQYVFSTGVTAISNIWDRLKGLAKAPIRFIVDTVLNKGLIGGFNWIANKFDAPTIKPIPLPKGFASGGHFDGKLPGPPSSKDNLIGYAKGGAFGLASGEFVVNAKQTSRHLPLLHAINDGEGGFASGGLIDKLKGAVTTGYSAGKNFIGDAADFLKSPVDWLKKRFAGPLGRLGELGDSPFAKIVKAAPPKLAGYIQDKAKSVLSDLFGGGINGPGITLNIGPQVGTGANRWRGVALQALAAAGAPASWINSLLRRMNQESGGNPRAINLWDSNAMRGDPSRGLMQTIGATFNAFAGPYRSRGIYDPFANIYAAIKYTVARYGSGPAGWNRKGGYEAGGVIGQKVGVYDKGGRWPSGTIGINTSGKTETVIPGDGMIRLHPDDLRQLAKLLSLVTINASSVDQVMSRRALSY